MPKAFAKIFWFSIFLFIHFTPNFIRGYRKVVPPELRFLAEVDILANIQKYRNIIAGDEACNG
jgi:hypothetical protein